MTTHFHRHPPFSILQVIKLIKSTLSALDIKQQLLQLKQQEQTRAIYAISFHGNNKNTSFCTESLATAHTKDQQLFRDALHSHQHATVLNHNCIEIQSSIEVKRHDVGQCQQERRNHMGQVATDRPGMTKTATVHNNKNNNNNTVRKATTAQAFFRGPSTTTTSTISTPSTTSEHHATESKNKKPFFGTSSLSKPKVTTTSTTTTTTTATKQGREKPVGATSVYEEKENAPNVVVGIGTADDFMGDEDEDEEFLQQEKLRQDRRQQQQQQQENKAVSSQRHGRQSKSTSAGTASASNHAVREEESNHGGEHEPETPRQQQPPSAVVLGKKRRKKLVEKTTMDAHGYMHTETHVEWEEIDVADEPSINVEKKKVVKNTKNMKQGSLMGFFAKK
jgi:hypothetical protein